MTDQNNFTDFNFENYGQEQTTDFGNEQALPQIQGDTQFFNQNESPIDPSAYFQGENAVLQESAGMGTTGNEETYNQTDTFQENTMDTNAIFGETLKTGTENSDYYGQAFQGITTDNTANVIEGNNLFGNTENVQVQETNIDPNALFSETNVENIQNVENVDTNAFFTQAQPIQPIQETTTTTETNTYFGQTQDIQQPFGEAQIAQGTETNTFFDASPVDYGQIQPQTTEGQNIYEPYQATKTEDINSFGYGTAETQPINIEPLAQPQTPLLQTPPQTPPPQPVFPPVVPLIQTKTTTTTTRTETNPIPPPIPQYRNQNLGQLDYEAYPATNAPVQQKAPQPHFDINQFQQTLNETPLTTSTTIIQPDEPQYIPENQQPVTVQQFTPPPTPTIVATPQPVVEATYTPPPVVQTIPRPVVQRRYVTRTVQKPVTPVTYAQTTNIVTPPPTQIIPQPQVQVVPQQQTVQIPYQTQTAVNPIVQAGKIPGYQYINKLVDEDFKRGRPLYSGTAIHPKKHQYNDINQFNQINPTPTYRVGDIYGKNKDNIGLSKLGAISSYNQVPLNTPSLNKIIPTINTPAIATPTINTPAIATPTVNIPNITTPTVNIPNIATPTVNIPNIATPTVNIPGINTPTVNIPTINTPTITTPNINTPILNTNIGNTLNNNINNINTNINNLNNNLGNNINNVVGNINTGLDKVGKASSYNVGAQSITPLLNNVGLNNVTTDNTRLPQLKDFL